MTYSCGLIKWFVGILLLAQVAGASPLVCQDLFDSSPSAALTLSPIEKKAVDRAREAASPPATELAETNKLQEKTGSLETALLLVRDRLKLTKYDSLKLYTSFKQNLLRVGARRLYRPLLLQGRHLMKEAGAFWRAYMIRRSMDLGWMRWSWVETLHEKGKDESSYGQNAEKGLVTVLSKIASPSADEIKNFRSQRVSVGRPVELSNGERIDVKPFELSLMINLSGMSYPQLSANAVLSLLYMNVKLAKSGIRYTYNTGEGGPSLHVALLDPATTKEEMSEAVMRYAIDGGFVKEGSVEQAEIETAVERLIEDRNHLFAEFSASDLAKAQIIGQLGPALNGARTADNKLDLRQLSQWAAHPFYAGTQFKLKQAAKKGAKVDASKVGALTAYLRKIVPNKNVEAPELSVEWSNVESLAEVILATKLVTHKPVSLKFAIGQSDEIYDMLKFLRDQHALPDHIQLDGSGYVRLPGSGNAPMMDNTSLNVTTATMIVDAILKDLKIRDEIYLESTGDIITPAEGLMNMSLGADGVSAARLWMGMGLGCALVMKCATGECYYGIANGDGKLFSEGLDPLVVGPKGAKAADYWFQSFSRLQLEAGARGRVPFRKQQGLSNPHSSIRIRGEFDLHTLPELFSFETVAHELSGRISRENVKIALFGSAKVDSNIKSSSEAAALSAVTDDLLNTD